MTIVNGIVLPDYDSCVDGPVGGVVEVPVGYPVNLCPLFCGTGSPEGVVTGPIGAIYEQTDAASTSHSVWFKHSGVGNTGWRQWAGLRGASGANTALRIGDNSVASGVDSVAIGENAEATAVSAIAIGKNTLASGARAEAIGQDSEATAADAKAFGAGAQATAARGIAIGQGSVASGIEGVAIGDVAVTAGLQAIAIGDAPVAPSDRAIAIGKGAIADALEALALGDVADAGGTQAVAIGNAANASAIEAVAIGDVALASATQALALGNASAASAVEAIAIGDVALASAARATALGNGANASAAEAIAIGDVALAAGIAGVAIGDAATAGGLNAIAVGKGAGSGKINSIAIGETVVLNDFEINIGKNNIGKFDSLTLNTILIGLDNDCSTSDDLERLVLLGYANLIKSTGTDSALVHIGFEGDIEGYELVTIGRNISATTGLVGGTAVLEASYGVAIGTEAEAQADCFVVIGYQAKGYGIGAVAVGPHSQAGVNGDSIHTTALGRFASVTADYSVALGSSAVVTHTEAIALGHGAASSGANKMRIGSVDAPIDVIEVMTSTGLKTVTMV